MGGGPVVGCGRAEGKGEQRGASQPSGEQVVAGATEAGAGTRETERREGMKGRGRRSPSQKRPAGEPLQVLGMSMQQHLGM